MLRPCFSGRGQTSAHQWKVVNELLFLLCLHAQLLLSCCHYLNTQVFSPSSLFLPIAQERGVSKREGGYLAADQGQPTTGSHVVGVTHLTFSGRLGKCISSEQQSRDLNMLSSHFPLYMVQNNLKTIKKRQLTHLCILFKINKIVDNYCAHFTVSQRKLEIRDAGAAFCPVKQLCHLHFFFSSRAIQRIVFLQEIISFKKPSNLCLNTEDFDISP